MKVLMANKYYFLKGGAERYMFELIKLLVKHGHSVVPFAMRHPKNNDSSYERYFVSEVETSDIGLGWQGLRTALRMTYSIEAARKFSALVRDQRPDLLHVQNIYHQISPSILKEAKKRKLPTVMTLHDYQLVSPNYSMFQDGKPAPPNKKHPYLWTFTHRSVRDSFAASALSAFKSWFQERLHLYDHVYRFIAPSEFMKKTVVEYGISAKRVEVIPHFIDLEGRKPSKEEGGLPADRQGVVFVGRLSPEKGIATLLQAMKELPDVRCSIVGEGPDRARLSLIVQDLGLKNVHFKGAKYGKDLEREIADARAVIVPSESYEVFGLTVLEAYAYGKPVIASKIGGLPEVVKEGETGFLFEPGNGRELAQKISAMTLEKARQMGSKGRKLAETAYTPEGHYKKIIALYEEAKRK